MAFFATDSYRAGLPKRAAHHLTPAHDPRMELLCLTPSIISLITVHTPRPWRIRLCSSIWVQKFTA